MIPHNAVEAARIFLAPALVQARCVVDATAGNGHDTLFFCEKTQSDCRIVAFDIQSAAINSSAALLQKHGMREKVQLILGDHARLQDYVAEPVQAAVFNLGYLPGQDHRITTTTTSLKPALERLLDLLSPNGRIAIVGYPGHEPGVHELDFLESYLTRCPQRIYTITRLSFINQINHPAILYSISKTKEGLL